MSPSHEHSTPPVFACTLPPAEFRQRRAEVLAAVRRKARQLEEMPDGFTFVFERSAGLEEELAEFVRFEAACCSFVRMEVVPRGEAALALRMTGAPAAKPFIRAEFVDAVPSSSLAVGAPACVCPPDEGACTSP